MDGYELAIHGAGCPLPASMTNLRINLFEQHGYDYVYAPDIVPDGGSPERYSYDEMVFTERLARP